MSIKAYKEKVLKQKAEQAKIEQQEKENNKSKPFIMPTVGKPGNAIFKVKITKCSNNSWYKNKVGEKFEVKENCKLLYWAFNEVYCDKETGEVISFIKFVILKTDCETIKQ